MPTGYYYATHGVIIESYLPLPELIAVEAPAQVDITISPGEIEHPTDDKIEDGRYLSVSSESIHFFYPDVGSFLIRGGREVIVASLAGVADEVLRLYLLGPVIGSLLHQRGHLVLHASSVAIGGEAIAFLGMSTWGKSTMAGALSARGHMLVTDDIAPIDNSGSGAVIWPGYPQLKLWPEAVTALGNDPELLPRLHPDEEKRAHRQIDNFAAGPLPLACIFVLAIGDEIRVDALPPQEALVELVRHSYAARLLVPSGMSGGHFLQCGKLIGSVPVRRLTRPRSLAALGDVAKMVEDHVALLQQALAVPVQQ